MPMLAGGLTHCLLALFFAHRERKSSEHRKVEERLRLAQDNTHLAMQRAITAEVDLLQQRVDNVMRPGEARLTEVDRIWYAHVMVHGSTRTKIVSSLYTCINGACVQAVFIFTV